MSRFNRFERIDPRYAMIFLAFTLPPALALAGLSCASAYMRGGQPVDSPPDTAIAQFTVSACTELATQMPVPMDFTLRYWLAEGDTGPVLYEQDPSGAVTMVTNHWVQADGADVFFMWVSRSSGFQFVVPQDRSGGVRFIYPHGRFKSYADGEISKVQGTAGVLCPMMKQ